MTDNYLTPADLRALTGRTHHAKQIAWLVAHGWVHAIDALGRPRVFRKYHDEKMGLGEKKKQGTTEPEYGVFRGRKTQAT